MASLVWKCFFLFRFLLLLKWIRRMRRLLFKKKATLSP